MVTWFSSWRHTVASPSPTKHTHNHTQTLCSISRAIERRAPGRAVAACDLRDVMEAERAMLQQLLTVQTAARGRGCRVSGARIESRPHRLCRNRSVLHFLFFVYPLCKAAGGREREESEQKARDIRTWSSSATLTHLHNCTCTDTLRHRNQWRYQWVGWWGSEGTVTSPLNQKHENWCS